MAQAFNIVIIITSNTFFLQKKKLSVWRVQQAVAEAEQTVRKLRPIPKRGSLVRWFLVLGSKRLETTEAWISFYLLLALVTSVVWLW